MRRIFAISDLHIGGDQHPMLGHPEFLTQFLNQLAAYNPPAAEEVELVVHGDLIDFLVEPPYEAWTASEQNAVTKLNGVFQRSQPLFDAFAKCAQKVRRLTLLLGNHDIELAYPRVREALFQRLGVDSHRCLFMTNDECYRVGDLLIEHGNRYDAWNEIHHDGLRHIVSCRSRGEDPQGTLRICPGSRLVQEVISPLKNRYPFIDLFKPEDKLLTLLLTTFEPELKRDLLALFRGASSYTKMLLEEASSKVVISGSGSGQRRAVSLSDAAFWQRRETMPESVANAFQFELQDQNDARRMVGVSDTLWKRFLEDSSTGLHARLPKGEEIEPNRLKKLQIALAAVMRSKVAGLSHESAPYTDAAKRMIASNTAKVIVMGHTHFACDVRLDGGGRYINTGTWADLIRIDDQLFEDTDEARSGLVQWLKKLVSHQFEGIRTVDPTYADIRVTDEGCVVDDGDPMLRHYDKTTHFG